MSGVRALLAATPAVGWSQAQTPAFAGVDFTPDLIVVNGNVLTMDARLQRAEALAVKDGRFIATRQHRDFKKRQPHICK